jgi:hypothetical protein
MNAGADMKDDAGIDEATGMDVQHAAVILRQARERARRELAVRRPLLFVAWGLVVLFGYGVMWLSVRGQHPFHGPTAPSIVTAAALVLTAAVFTAWATDRATRGIGGRSLLQRGTFVLALAAGGVTLGNFTRAVAHAGASRPLIALLGAAAPLLVAGLVFVASCAIYGSLDWPRLALGLWLLAVAAGGAWGGAVTNLAVYALAGGGGILLMAAIEPGLRRS